MEEWQLDVELPPIPPTHLDEAYSSYYALDVDGIAGNDLAMRLHPNGLCVVALAPSHAALRQPAPPLGGSSSSRTAGGGAEPAAAAAAAEAGITVGFNDVQEGEQQTAAADCSQRQQQGSGGAQLVLGQRLLQAEFRKGRGPWLQLDTVLGRLTGCGPTEYVLRCTAHGPLIELNSRLEQLQGQELLRALNEEYLAILEIRAAEVQQLAARSLSGKQYQQWRQKQHEQQHHEQQPAAPAGQ